MFQFVEVKIFGKPVQWQSRPKHLEYRVYQRFRLNLGKTRKMIISFHFWPLLMWTTILWGCSVITWNWLKPKIRIVIAKVKISDTHGSKLFPKHNKQLNKQQQSHNHLRTRDNSFLSFLYLISRSSCHKSKCLNRFAKFFSTIEINWHHGASVKMTRHFFHNKNFWEYFYVLGNQDQLLWINKILILQCKLLVVTDGHCGLWSISQTIYKQLFRTKVFWATFLCLHLGL